MTEFAIEARGLGKTYRGDVQALDGMSFQSESGTIFALLGPNGAGKTTTMRILTTLSRPDSGSARVAGIDVVANPIQVRQVIGAVGQRPAGVRTLTGRENLHLQGALYGIHRVKLKSRCEELLAAFGLHAAADRLVRTYSGGMVRKLDLAIGLVNCPRVLFLDEPTTGLDPEARAETWSVLRALAAEDGTSMLLTTHYLEEADQYAARVAIVDRGRVVTEGSPDDLKAQLGGDSVNLSFDSASSALEAASALAPTYGNRALLVERDEIRATVENGAHQLPSLLHTLESHKIPVAAVTVSRPSLDDVYLRHTGRSFTSAEEVAA
jgi:ABC-2 type transport system ATP-binding protein